MNPTDHAANDTASAVTGLTTLDPAASHVTIINTYVVASERAEELLGFLERSTRSTLSHVPGFVSANLHLSVDRTQVVNYAQWTSREAIAAARENPKVAALMQEQARIAESFTPILYELRISMGSAAS